MDRVDSKRELYPRQADIHPVFMLGGLKRGIGEHSSYKRGDRRVPLFPVNRADSAKSISVYRVSEFGLEDTLGGWAARDGEK